MTEESINTSGLVPKKDTNSRRPLSRFLEGENRKKSHFSVPCLRFPVFLQPYGSSKCSRSTSDAGVESGRTLAAGSEMAKLGSDQVSLFVVSARWYVLGKRDDSAGNGGGGTKSADV